MKLDKVGTKIPHSGCRIGDPNHQFQDCGYRPKIPGLWPYRMSKKNNINNDIVYVIKPDMTGRRKYQSFK
jgi:hypothetical protein